MVDQLVPRAENPSRLRYQQMPSRLLRLVDEWFGSPVVGVSDQPGGFSPGVAARITSADGRKAFVKAAGPELNPDTPGMHRREASIATRLPQNAPVARLLDSIDEGDDGWVVLLYEDLGGRTPSLPWKEDELAHVLQSLKALANTLTPSPIEAELAGNVPDFFRDTIRLRGWVQLPEGNFPRLDEWTTKNLVRLIELEDHAPEAAVGPSLVHLDIRADNIVLTGDDVFFVDWPAARIGAPWIDLVAFAPSVGMQGGPHLTVLLDEYGLPPVVTEGDVNAVLSMMAGYFVVSSFLPPPAGIPGVRQFQAAQGAVALRWLKERLG